jgi:hypothetical protein
MYPRAWMFNRECLVVATTCLRSEHHTKAMIFILQVNTFRHTGYSYIPASVFPKDSNIKNHQFTHCFTWLWNLVSHTKVRTQIEGVWEQGAEEGGSGGRLEESA